MRKTAVPVARPHRDPVGMKVCTGCDLAKALRKVNLPADEAKAWHRDLKIARKALKAPLVR